MAQCKYIAAGFVSDAEKLLGDFIQENSMEFSVFAAKWRKWNFSFIYMGRTSERELKEFTQEIFYLSSRFLYSSSLLYQVGGIYLLYALYRNQILVPPVRIRLIVNQWKTIKALRESFVVKEHPSLHYVINYLIENCLDYVACPSLMGPVLTNLAEARKIYESECASKTQVSQVGLVQLVQSNILKDIDKMHMEYNKTKSLLKIPAMGDETSLRFDKFEKCLDNLLDHHGSGLSVISSSNAAEMQVSGSVKSSSVSSNIGKRRSRLKAKATAVTKTPSRYNSLHIKSAVDKSRDSAADESMIDDPICLEQNSKGGEMALQQSTYRRRRVSNKRRIYSTTQYYYKLPGKECDDLKMVSKYESLIFPSQHENVVFSDSDDKESLFSEPIEEHSSNNLDREHSSESDNVFQTPRDNV